MPVMNASFIAPTRVACGTTRYGACRSHGGKMKCDCCSDEAWRPLFAENGIRLGTCATCDLHSIEDIPQGQARMNEMEEGHSAGSREIPAATRQLPAEKDRKSVREGKSGSDRVDT